MSNIWEMADIDLKRYRGIDDGLKNMAYILQRMKELKWYNFIDRHDYNKEFKQYQIALYSLTHHKAHEVRNIIDDKEALDMYFTVNGYYAS